MACLLGGLGALWFGFALDWDLLNYHFYNAHALVHGRLLTDIAPAQQQTYLNPALDLPGYLLFSHFNSAVLVFVTGAIQASQLVLLYGILVELVDSERRRGWMLLTVAALGLLGPIFLVELGGSQGDSLLSALVLGALLALLREQKRSDAARAFRSGLLSGFLLGAACALKLTMAPYGVGMLVAAFTLLGGARRWKVSAGMGLGGLLGLGLLGGPWFGWLWHTWESPLFPFFNGVFHSSWISEESFRDPRFLPRNPAEWWLYPWYWSVDPLRVWEYPFRDLRVPLLYSLALLAPLVFVGRPRRRAPGLALVWLFAIVSYILWLKTFSIYRYLAVIEMLAPLLIFSTLVAIFRRPASAVVALVLLLSSQALVTFHRPPSSSLLQRDSETLLAALPADAMIVIGGYSPVAYAALWLDDRIPLVRIRANFLNRDIPDTRLHVMADHRVVSHQGPRYLLVHEAEREASIIDRDLARVGLSLGDRSTCAPVFRDAELQRSLQLFLCDLQPIAASGVLNQGTGR